ncbi:MAG: hypothetical protein PHO92_04140 [Candidatus Peribacteraceae bacterium]|nr:hypothetical protein [Candidatus Peribacteraceae bacterium]
MESDTTTPEIAPVHAPEESTLQEPGTPAEPDPAEERLQRRIRILRGLPEDMAERRELLAHLLSDRFVTHEPSDVLVGLCAAYPESLLAQHRQQLADYLLQKERQHEGCGAVSCS